MSRDQFSNTGHCSEPNSSTESSFYYKLTVQEQFTVVATDFIWENRNLRNIQIQLKDDNW